MKNTLFTLIVIGLFGPCAAAQQNGSFKLSTDKPEAGKEIGFVYTFSPSRMLRPRPGLSYQKAEKVQVMSLRGKYSRGRIEGKFRLPDSTYAFRILTDNRQNGTEVYVFQVHKKGKPVKGAYAATAQFYGKAGSGIRDVKKSLSLFRQEFAINPEQRPRYLLDYFNVGHFNPDPTILKELAKTAQDSIERGTNESFLTKFYNIAVNYGIVELKEQLKSHLLAKYPRGQLAFTLARVGFWDRITTEDHEKEFGALEQNFTEQIAAGALDETYYNFARRLFKMDSIRQGEIYLHKIRSRDLQRELYAYAASQVSHSRSNKEKAPFFIQKAIDMTGEKGIFRSGYLFSSGQIQHALGNLDAALSDVKASLSPYDFGDSQTRVYLQYLQEAGKYKTALDVAEAFIKSQPESVAIKNSFMKIYSKIKGGDAGAEERYQALIKIRDKRLKIIKYNELDVTSINFKLNDIQGKPFVLSNLIGTSVVLYFFTVPTTARSAMSNEYFNKVAAEYQFREDVVFVGIEKSYNQSIAEATGKAERLEKLKKYIERNRITYPVIQDQWIPGANAYGGHFKLAEEYSVDGTSQFYIIDKKGTVRYKNSGSQYIPAYFYTELKAALKLIK